MYCQRLFVDVAEEARAQVEVAEDEAAEVGDEGLDARAQRDEVVVAARWSASLTSPKASSSEKSWRRRVSPSRTSTSTRFRSLTLQVVEVEGAGGLEGPGLGLEGGLAREQLGGEEGPRGGEELVAVAEELEAARVRGADPAAARAGGAPRTGASRVPVRTRKMELPTTGLSPFSVFWL